MLRLETFGGLRLTGAAGANLVPQRRRLALLALLAVAGDRGIRREKLLTYLWPESPEPAARHALEQLVYSLRQHLPGVLLGPDPLRLDPAAVQTDLEEFSARLAGDDLRGAVELYRGPFLDGFFLDGAPEFERWAERERARLAGEHERALRALAREAEAQGRHTAEIQILRDLAAADPLDERAATDLLRALAAVDDWTGAGREAQAYMARARAELPGVQPSDLERLVDRLRDERRRQQPERSTGGDEPADSAERYQLERELGRGAAAIVYLARDRRYDRPVALKLLRPEVATATDARRFRREIAILAHLYHPHILQLYDSGVMPPGGPIAGLFYVMPYVRGESLRQRLKRTGPLPVDQAVGIACDVAEAVAHAHAQGIIHRDISPENILIESGHAMVADFGIAGVLESAAGDRLSASGIVLGRATYASPEQALGSRALDGRTDIYSLGCVLYEMLAGDPPFTGATQAAILARQQSDAVPPLRTVRPDVSAELERTLLRALAKRPEDRYPTAAEFGQALRLSARAGGLSGGA